MTKTKQTKEVKQKKSGNHKKQAVKVLALVVSANLYISFYMLYFLVEANTAFQAVGVVNFAIATVVLWYHNIR